jgi:hypothetical protein
MSKIDNSFPANDPDQLVVAPVSSEKYYLGNSDVVHTFVGQFANDVMRAYGDYLSGKSNAGEAQSLVEAIVREHGNALMGRDGRYEIAPWQGSRMRGKLLAAIPSMKGDDDPGEAFFRHLALQCVKASLALKDGKPEKEVGEQLKEILDDARGRILGVIV